MKQMSITSSAFKDRERMPAVYTCDGEDINPPLEFHDVPEEAQSLALLVDDPDSPGKTWSHWILFNIDPQVTRIGEDSVPRGAIEAVTDFGEQGYGGPCPASGTHRYSFRLFALDKIMDFTEDVTREELLDAMDGRIIDQAEITALYARE